MNKCWEHDPDSRPAFSELSRDIQCLLTGLADYLSLEAITGFMAPSITITEDDNQVHEESNLGKSLSTSSLSLKHHDIITPVGISIHLERTPSIIFEEEQKKLQNGSVPVQNGLTNLAEAGTGKTLTGESDVQCNGTITSEF